MIQGKGNGDARYAFFERRRLIFARRHVFCCRLRRLQDAAALDPVQRLRTAIGRICRAGLADSRARLKAAAGMDKTSPSSSTSVGPCDKNPDGGMDC